MRKMDDSQQPGVKARTRLSIKVPDSHQGPTNSPRKQQQPSPRHKNDSFDSDSDSDDDDRDDENESDNDSGVQGLRQDAGPKPLSKPGRPARPAKPQPRPSLSNVPPEVIRLIKDEVLKEVVEQLQHGDDPRSMDRPLETSQTLSGQSSRTNSTAHHANPVNTEAPNNVSPKFSTTRPASHPVVGGAPHSPTFSQASQSPRTSSVRFSDPESPVTESTRRSKRQSASVSGMTVELSAVDQAWGVLFDDNGQPTKRLEQVLKGLANYIVDEFLPPRSIVITPEKLAAFYSFHRLDGDTYPFATLFKSTARDFNQNLADLYQDLGCQYHLVPADPHSRPEVPGLTPTGFMQWFVTSIQAYPNEEARRLGKIVTELPINADSPLDGRNERLPKQISRHLLPAKANRKMRQIFDGALNDFIEDLKPPMSSRSSFSQSKPAAERRTSNISPRSRYVPLATEDTLVEDAVTHDRGGKKGGSPRTQSREPHMPPPPIGRHHSVTGTNRSPQRRPGSQSVPSGINLPGGSGLHGSPSSTSSVLFTPTSASMSPAFELASARGRDHRDRDDGGRYYSVAASRPGLDDTPRAASYAGSDKGSRRSSGMFDPRGQTWDEYLKHRESTLSHQVSG